MKEDYVSFEVAKLLKEKGFNESCDNYYDQSSDEPQQLTLDEMYYSYDEFIKAPTHQMACKWLRKEHNLYVSPKYRCFCGSKKNDKPYYKWEDRVLKLPSNNQIHPQIYGIHEYYETYEEAVEAALKYSLKNLF